MPSSARETRQGREINAFKNIKRLQSIARLKDTTQFLGTIYQSWNNPCLLQWQEVVKGESLQQSRNS